MRDPAELAPILARKAEEDAFALGALTNSPGVADGIIGFHAQQAIEKWLKAAIAARGSSPERSHDLGRLVQVLEGMGERPPRARELDELTIYAVPWRYDEFGEAEPLERGSTVDLVGEVESWARDRLSAMGIDV